MKGDQRNLFSIPSGMEDDISDAAKILRSFVSHVDQGKEEEASALFPPSPPASPSVKPQPVELFVEQADFLSERLEDQIRSTPPRRSDFTIPESSSVALISASGMFDAANLAKGSPLPPSNEALFASSPQIPAVSDDLFAPQSSPSSPSASSSPSPLKTRSQPAAKLPSSPPAPAVEPHKPEDLSQTIPSVALSSFQAIKETKSMQDLLPPDIQLPSIEMERLDVLDLHQDPISLASQEFSASETTPEIPVAPKRKPSELATNPSLKTLPVLRSAAAIQDKLSEDAKASAPAPSALSLPVGSLALPVGSLDTATLDAVTNPDPSLLDTLLPKTALGSEVSPLEPSGSSTSFSIDDLLPLPQAPRSGSLLQPKDTKESSAFDSLLADRKSEAEDAGASFLLPDVEPAFSSSPASLEPAFDLLLEPALPSSSVDIPAEPLKPTPPLSLRPAVTQPKAVITVPEIEVPSLDEILGPPGSKFTPTPIQKTDSIELSDATASTPGISLDPFLPSPLSAPLSPSQIAEAIAAPVPAGELSISSAVIGIIERPSSSFTLGSQKAVVAGDLEDGTKELSVAVLSSETPDTSAPVRQDSGSFASFALDPIEPPKSRSNPSLSTSVKAPPSAKTSPPPSDLSASIKVEQKKPLSGLDISAGSPRSTDASAISTLPKTPAVTSSDLSTPGAKARSLIKDSKIGMPAISEESLKDLGEPKSSVSKAKASEAPTAKAKASEAPTAKAKTSEAPTAKAKASEAPTAKAKTSEVSEAVPGPTLLSDFDPESAEFFESPVEERSADREYKEFLERQKRENRRNLTFLFVGGLAVVLLAVGIVFAARLLAPPKTTTADAGSLASATPRPQPPRPSPPPSTPPRQVQPLAPPPVTERPLGDGGTAQAVAPDSTAPDAKAPKALADAGEGSEAASSDAGEVKTAQPSKPSEEPEERTQADARKPSEEPEERPAAPPKAAVRKTKEAKKLSAQAQGQMLEGEIEKAQTLAKKATQADPEHPDGWRILGLTYIRQGKKAEAKAAFLRFQELSPKNPLASQLLQLVK